MSSAGLLFFSAPIVIALLLFLVGFIFRRKERAFAAKITFLVGVYTVLFGAFVFFAGGPFSFVEVLFLSIPLLLSFVLVLLGFILRHKNKAFGASIAFLIGAYTVLLGAIVVFRLFSFFEVRFLSIPLLLSFVLALLGFILRHKNRAFAGSITFLVGIYIVPFNLYYLLERRSYLGFYLAAPLSGAFQVTAIIIGLLLTFRLYSAHIFAGKSEGETSDYSTPAVLKDAISRILDSEKFLTALRSSLPRGEGDEEFGFDYIPFMLSAIDERRRRAQKSARFFLLATTVSAVIFSGIVMYFGYILVNEASAGTAKTLADIKVSTEATSEAIHSIIPSYYNNPEFQKNVAPSLERLTQLDPGEKNKQAREKIVSAINEAKRTGDFLALNSALAQAQLNKESDQEKTYSTVLGDATNGMSAFLGAQSVAIPELNSRIQELKTTLIPKAEDALSKPENRLPEIIKRLALGLVIATFFLALLRYMGTLYRTRYQQVLAAENDDFMVRRFYIAFKSSEASDEQRKTVLASFMAAQSVSAPTDGKESGDGTKEQYEVLKDLLGALSKKL